MEDIKLDGPQMRVVDYLKEKNKDNGKVVAGQYFGSNYTYDETFKMFNDYKKAFLSLEGKGENGILIASPSTISSVNAFFGAMDANKIACPIGQGFLQTFTERYVKESNAKTVFALDLFLNEDLINNLAKAGVKNIIVTTISDYMNPVAKAIAKTKGQIPKVDFIDAYVRSGKSIPQGLELIRLKDFAKVGSKIKEDTKFPYREDQIVAHFLTGATTSQTPKTVRAYGDEFITLGEIYNTEYFDLNPGEVNTIFIPIFYGTGASNSIYAGLINGMTNNYKPKYDKYAFAKDLQDSKAVVCVVAPSHVATLFNSKLPDNALSHVKYIYIGGEAVTPAWLERARSEARRLGIKEIINGYGQTEMFSMTGISKMNPERDDDVSIYPVPGMKYRVVDDETREVLGKNQRGILETSYPKKLPGYLDGEKNKELFTKDGWVHSGDSAIMYDDGSVRVFGRGTDFFKNNGKSYAMFDIEEAILNHPGVNEAEVIKFEINGNEYPAAIVVLNEEWQTRLPEFLNYMRSLKVPGIEYLLGTRFIDNFRTNEITGKRDYLSLPKTDRKGYYKMDDKFLWQLDLLDDLNTPSIFTIPENELTIYFEQKSKVKSL